MGKQEVEAAPYGSKIYGPVCTPAMGQSVTAPSTFRHAPFLVGGLEVQLLDAPVEKFGHVKLVFAGAGDFVDPAELA